MLDHIRPVQVHLSSEQTRLLPEGRVWSTPQYVIEWTGHAQVLEME